MNEKKDLPRGTIRLSHGSSINASLDFLETEMEGDLADESHPGGGI